ncbi:hypothetical protein [Candidatus Frankia alpina]|uniref:hypothetical protein n=1 Tax=Candidatus Frankia alpina TaxID=2699483 RepID=UPI001F358B22|nr:hypothetical protein [Candidatus Frankia alpina]
MNIPGIDPDGPPASAAQLAAWATPLQTHLTALRAGVPASLTGQVEVLAAAVRGAQGGKPVNTDDASLNAALAAVNGWVHDFCGYTTLDVTDNGGVLTGVPSTLPAGPMVLKFTNTGADASKAGFILLLGKLHPDQSTTVADVSAGKTDLGSVADIVTVAQPTGSAPAYGLTTLRPGSYLLASPTGQPPTFSGTLAAGFTVG